MFLKQQRLEACCFYLVLASIGWRCTAVPTFSATTDFDLPNTTESGYLPVNKKDGSEIFFTYYEATASQLDKDTPIILWLQGGPGCAGHFGSFYELGPQLVVNASLSLEDNPGAWNRKAGLLIVDQPVGTGFSPSGKGHIPSNEVEIASDMYVALQDFFGRHENLQKRPFVITGESYAGKYVPSLGHFILQMERLHGLKQVKSAFPLNTSLPANALSLGAPNFNLVALAIGNGLTDPIMQVQTHADTAFFQGLIDTQQRMTAMAMQMQVSQAITAEQWQWASSRREALLEFLQGAIGAGTMLDYRRVRDYDADKVVDKYLNLAEVKEHLGVHKDIEFVSCSEEVGRVLGADIMKSVKHVIPDLLAHLPMLLYQGAFDAQDGPATSESWIHSLDWPGRMAFAATERKIWRAHPDGTVPRFDDPTALEEEVGRKKELGRVLGYWREWGSLRHVVVREAGHMVPHDDPLVAQAMLESWLHGVLGRLSMRA